MKYLIVDEWSAPTYYLHDTSEELYDECDQSIQALWAVSYDESEHEIIEWLERFMVGEEDKAGEYIKQLEKGEKQ